MRRSDTEQAWHGRPVPAPAEERWAGVEGIRTRYLYCRAADCRPAGAPHGCPVLLIHGLLGYSFSWRFNLAALSQCGEVYALDLPGMGYSDRFAPMDRSASGLAQFLLRFMDAVSMGSADVIGTSHGGALAMMLAGTMPERVRRLVLVAPVNPWSEEDRWSARLLATRPGAWLARQLWNAGPGINTRALERMYGDPARIAPGTVEAYSAPLAIPGALEHLLEILASWTADYRQLAPVLPRIAHIPTLLVWGSRDTVVRPDSAAPLLKQLTRAELVILDGAGHLPYEEVPEAFNRVVAGFLARP